METISVFGLLRKGRVTRFWSAYTFSTLGHELILFALTVHIYKLTGSVLDMGIFTSLNFIPRVLFAPLAGSFIDRYDRRRVFIGCVLAKAVSVALILFVREMSLIYLLWFLISTLFVVMRPVRVAIMAELVDQKEFLPVNSLVFGTLSLVRIVAPPVGGLLVAAGGIQPALYFDIAVFIAAGLSMATVSLPPPVKRKHNRQTVSETARHIWEGAAYLFRNPGLRYLIESGFAWRLFMAIQIPLFVVYVQDVLGGDVDDYGVFMMVVGLGSAMGSLVGNRIGELLLTRQIIIGGLAASFLAFALLAVTNTFWVACLLVWLSFVTFFAAVVNIHAERDRLTPNELRGRVYSSVSALFAPIGLVSVLAGTALAQRFGVEIIFFGAGLAAIVVLFVITHFSKVSVIVGHSQI